MIIKSRRIKKILVLINSILLIIVILFTPLAYYIFNLNFYGVLFEKNGVYSILNKDDVLNVSEKIIDFFKYKSDLDYRDPTIQVRFADKSKSAILSFKPEEISHLYDVRTLITRIFIIYYSTVFLFLIIVLLLWERNIRNFFRNLGMIFIISSVVMIIFIAVLYLLGRNFPVLFDNFHQLFFPQGNYSFMEGSLIITLFPFGFFYDFFERLVLGSAIISVIFLFVGLIFTYILKFVKK